jgi:hypothetical protein
MEDGLVPIITLLETLPIGIRKSYTTEQMNVLFIGGNINTLLSLLFLILH